MSIDSPSTLIAHLHSLALSSLGKVGQGTMGGHDADECVGGETRDWLNGYEGGRIGWRAWS